MSEKPSSYGTPDNVSRTMGREAQRNNILAARVIADIVKTTLGPKGMDKMLVDSLGNITVTNDGVTILEEMEIDHPAAKMMVEVAKTQESEVGDGTTTAALLAGKLLEEAEYLLDKKIHPTSIVKGYQQAAAFSLSALQELAIPVRDKKILNQIAMTAMTGKGAEGTKEKLAHLIVNAVEQVAQGTEISMNDIKMQKLRGNSIMESELIQGIVIEKEKANDAMPTLVSNAKILLIDSPLEIRSPETEAKISISSPDQLQQFLESEERTLQEISSKLVSSGANVIFCQKGIDDVVQYYLAKEGIFASRRVARSDMERIAKATSARIVSSISDIHPNDFGFASVVKESRRGDDVLTYIQGCRNPRSVSILIRGGTTHILDEIERAMKDGMGDVISAIKIGKAVPGGGAVEMALSKKLRSFSHTLSGREQLAVESFAKALESIPETLAENAGLDPIEILTELKKRHELHSTQFGLNLFTNKVEDTFAAGIIEPLKVKTQAISSATEVATMILRIDDVLISKGNSSKNALPSVYDGMD